MRYPVVAAVRSEDHFWFRLLTDASNRVRFLNKGMT
jgi:hypothetical protein